jgi:hypothetical protein
MYEGSFPGGVTLKYPGVMVQGFGRLSGQTGADETFIVE